MTVKEQQQHPIFAACIRTAALKDLQFCLRSAERLCADFAFGPTTLAIMGEMAQMERALDGVASTPALQKRVWSLIDRFRGSIPRWAEKSFPPTRRADGRRRWVGHRTTVPQRRVTLTTDEVCALIQSQTIAIVDAPQKPSRKPAAKRVGMVCPSCQGELLPTSAQTFGCAQCLESWTLAPAKRPVAVPRPKVARVARVVAGSDRTICSKCQQPAPAEEFGTRSDCRACRQSYRQQRKVAA